MTPKHGIDLQSSLLEPVDTFSFLKKYLVFAAEYVSHPASSL
jgi:hypothetical protein